MPTWLYFPIFYLSYLNPIEEEPRAGVFKFSLSCKHVFCGACCFIHSFLLLCTRDTAILFNFIIKHTHLASGQSGTKGPLGQEGASQEQLL